MQNSVIAIVGLALLTSCQGAQRNTACDAAVSQVAWFAKDYKKSPVIFSDEARSVSDLSKADWYETDGYKSTMPPPAGLVAAFARRTPVAAITVCADAEKYLDDRGIKHGKAAVDALVSSSAWRDMSNKVRLVGVALPVINDGGNEALIEVSSSIGVMAGAGSVWHLRRQSDEQWKTVGVARGWIA